MYTLEAHVQKDNDASSSSSSSSSSLSSSSSSSSLPSTPNNDPQQQGFMNNADSQQHQHQHHQHHHHHHHQNTHNTRNVQMHGIKVPSTLPWIEAAFGGKAERERLMFDLTTSCRQVRSNKSDPCFGHHSKPFRDFLQVLENLAMAQSQAQAQAQAQTHNTFAHVKSNRSNIYGINYENPTVVQL